MTPTAALLGWYRQHARDLPWRGERDPYRIWVSEVLLQQTQVETVRPHYERFVARFPTLLALANAELDDVLHAWQGLGYYRRARNLHAAARAIVEQHGGSLPADLVALRALPGVGEYTAAAVASIAFGVPVAAIDGNAQRVLARLHAIAGDVTRGEPRRRLRELAEALLDAAAPGDSNQALMELGAVVCTPTAPRCPACPLAPFCAALAAGEPTRYPERPPRPAPRRRLHVCAVIRSGRGLLLAQRPPDGRWGGLWELPRVELEPDADPVEGLRAGLDLALEVGPCVAKLRHAVSGESIELRAYACAAPGEPRPAGYGAVAWVGADRSGFALSTAQRKLLAALDSLGSAGAP